VNRITAFTTAALLAVATACSNTAKGVEKDAEKAGDKMSDATERAADATASGADNAGASMGAAMETADVKTALMADSRVSAGDINVDTNNDVRTVTLKGTVPTADQKRIAEEIAKVKAPEYKIINDLTVRAP
jgi:osmotically-inducible protein OsmY